MSETRYNIDQDLKEAAAMAEGLEEYVRGDQLYGRTTGGFFGGNMPALTIGGLLLRLEQLHAHQATLNPAQQAQLAAIDARHEAVRREWDYHYNLKLKQEALSRLKAMDAYFSEMQDEPRSAVNSYLPEALRRTIAQVLANILPPDDEIKAALRKADGGLRRWTEPGDFLWATELEDVYPRDKYWWLYVHPLEPQRAQ